MSYEGAIHDRELADALLVVGREGRTGILTVQGEEEIIGVSFLGGEVVSADALNQSLEDGLGEVLASRDLVRPEDFSTLAAEHQAGGGRVVYLLVERSYLTREELLGALRFHTYRLCRQVLHWRTGEFKFYRGDEVSFEDGIVPISVEELLIKAAQDLGTQGPLTGRVPSLDTIYRRLDGSGSAVSADSLPPELLTDLGNEVLLLMEKIDGRRTVLEVLQEAGIEKHKALLMVYRLEEVGQIQSEEEAITATPIPTISTTDLLGAAGAAAAREADQDGWLDSLRTRAVEKPKRISEYPPWPSRLLAIGLVVGLVSVVLMNPRFLILPFPGQRDLRQELENLKYSAAFLKIDRSAKTFFLLEGRFPESLNDLVERGFLHSEDLLDPTGDPFEYSALASGYMLHRNQPEEASPITSRAETITGNFLLDPEFVVPELTERPPLILLD
ncbi:MAG: DUF4388 domain-containing protein [Thermoanaerobaculia bacterium]